MARAQRECQQSVADAIRMFIEDKPEFTFDEMRELLTSFGVYVRMDEAVAKQEKVMVRSAIYGSGDLAYRNPTKKDGSYLNISNLSKDQIPDAKRVRAKIVRRRDNDNQIIKDIDDQIFLIENQESMKL